VTQEVINTRILRSQASSAAHGEVAKHDYDVVEVTVSPRKVVARPPPSKMREVSPTPVRLAAGPSRSIEAPSKPTQPSPSQEVSMLTRLTEITKYLAKGCKNGDDGMDVQARISMFHVFISCFLHSASLSMVQAKVSEALSRFVNCPGCTNSILTIPSVVTGASDSKFAVGVCGVQCPSCCP